MFSISRWLLSPALFVGWLGLTLTASAAVAPVINDDGKFFSAEAVDKANAQIKKIAQDYDKDLLIETFADIPADIKKDYQSEKKKEFFEKWARDRAHEKAVNGVYVLICKAPAHLQVEVGNRTQKKAFTLRNRNELAKILLEKFRAKKYDEGLLDAVDYYGKTLQQNLGRTSKSRVQANEEWPGHGRKSAGAPSSPEEGGRRGNPIMGYICIGVVVLLGFWVLFGVIRAFTGAGRGGYGGYGGGGYGGYGGGGGGFFNSLLGGMFGAAAGMWMYDHFFSGSSGWGSAAHAGTSPDSMDPGTGLDTDYYGTGGDFGGDDGGGGDFGGDDGGGDFGGGDFGGGDFGGGDFGGGDFGGGDFGGGDFGGGDFGGGDF